jgi:hypothetical protein
VSLCDKVSTLTDDFLEQSVRPKVASFSATLSSVDLSTGLDHVVSPEERLAGENLMINLAQSWRDLTTSADMISGILMGVVSIATLQ